ncbi:Uncharacterised protein [Paenibacillus thiaminolyticus]|nr:Uncharacterised protein [Paenibacillus thiaminolyticus]
MYLCHNFLEEPVTGKEVGIPFPRQLTLPCRTGSLRLWNKLYGCSVLQVSLVYFMFW